MAYGRQQFARRPGSGWSPPVSGPRVRAGLMTTRHMDYAGVADVEALMTAEGLTAAPITTEARPVERVLGAPHITVSVLPTAAVADIAAGGLAGVVIPASPEPRAPQDDATIVEVVGAARAENLPVIAFGDSVGIALAAVGLEPPQPSPAAVLMHDGVFALETEDDVRDALKTFKSKPTDRKAA